MRPRRESLVSRDVAAYALRAARALQMLSIAAYSAAVVDDICRAPSLRQSPPLCQRPASSAALLSQTTPLPHLRCRLSCQLSALALEPVFQNAVSTQATPAARLHKASLLMYATRRKHTFTRFPEYPRLTRCSFALQTRALFKAFARLCCLRSGPETCSSAIRLPRGPSMVQKGCSA